MNFIFVDSTKTLAKHQNPNLQSLEVYHCSFLANNKYSEFHMSFYLKNSYQAYLHPYLCFTYFMSPCWSPNTSHSTHCLGTKHPLQFTKGEGTYVSEECSCRRQGMLYTQGWLLGFRERNCTLGRQSSGEWEESKHVWKGLDTSSQSGLIPSEEKALDLCSRKHPAFFRHSVIKYLKLLPSVHFSASALLSASSLKSPAWLTSPDFGFLPCARSSFSGWGWDGG